MTSTSETTGQQVNGAGPAPAAADTGDGPVPVSERVMGLFGFAFAIVLAGIALDLITGGWLSGLLAGGRGDTDADN